MASGDDVRYGFSRATGLYYRITAWEQTDDGGISPLTVERVGRDHVPETVLTDDEWVEVQEVPPSAPTTALLVDDVR